MNLINMIDAMRLARGYVSFSASGGFPDKFLNSCREKGVTLFDVQRINGVITASAFISDYRKMPAIRRDSDMKIKIAERRGLPFVIYRRRNRVGLLFGVAAFIILLIILSGSVWSVSVEGNEKTDENDIIRAFSEEGIYQGARISRINTEGAEEKVIAKVDGLIWASFNNTGGLGVIKVIEGEDIPSLKNDSPPRNVIAKYDGQITEYEVYEGSAEQQKNAAVLKGDLLISGILSFADGSTILRAADGKVEAKTERSVEYVLDESFELYRADEVRPIVRLQFFGLSIPIYAYAFWEDESERKKFSVSLESAAVINEITLPVGVEKEQVLAGEQRAFEADGRSLLIGLDEFFKAQSVQMDKAEILKSKTEIQMRETSIAYRSDFSAIESICEYSEIIYEQEKE